MTKRTTSYKSYAIPIVLAVAIEVFVLLVLFVNWSSTPDSKPAEPAIVAALYALQSEGLAEKQIPLKIQISPEKQLPPKEQATPEKKLPPEKTIHSESKTPPEKKLPPEKTIHSESKAPPKKNVSIEKQTPPETNKANEDQEKLLKELLSNNGYPPPSGDGLSNQVVGRIDDLVRQKIQKNWTELGNPLPNSQVELLIEMSPNGTIINVLVNRSSGNIVFDNSAVTAAKNVGRILEVEQLDINTFNQLYRKRAFIFTAKGL